MRNLVATAVVATLGATAASASDDPQTITDQEADDIATAIAASPHANLELASLGEVVEVARGRAVGGAFHEDDRGLATDYQVACRDEDDAPIAVCSSDTRGATAAVEARGSVDEAAQQAQTVRAARWQLANVNGDGPTLVSGSATLDHAARDTFAGDTWDVRMQYAATYEDVAVSLANGSDARPVGGTIDYDVTFSRTHAGEQRSFETTARVVFDDNGGARLAVAGRNYHVDSPLGNLQRD